VSIIRNTDGLRVSTIAQGRTGCGPPSIKQGDRVGIFSYTKTAHIIRCISATEQTTYALIGGAYVHGTMSGEIEDLGIEEQDVVLV
jgi:hypothetical protein